CRLLIWVNAAGPPSCSSLCAFVRTIGRPAPMPRKAALKFGLISFFIVAVMGGDLWGAESGPGSEAFPNRPITIVVPWAPGGPSDTLSRIVARHMSRTLGQRVIVQNNVGAGGTIAALYTARAAPDGYRLFTGNTGT